MTLDRRLSTLVKIWPQPAGGGTILAAMWSLELPWEIWRAMIAFLRETELPYARQHAAIIERSLEQHAPDQGLVRMSCSDDITLRSLTLAMAPASGGRRHSEGDEGRRRIHEPGQPAPPKRQQDPRSPPHFRDMACAPKARDLRANRIIRS